MANIIERRANSTERAMVALGQVYRELNRPCWRALFLEDELDAAREELDLLSEAILKLDTEGFHG